MPTAHYSINKLDELILVRTTGEWTLAMEVAYLAELSQVFVQTKSHHYAVVVDMRGYRSDQQVRKTSIKHALYLDRRGQIAEYWICDDLSQSEHLVDFFKAETFPLHRITDDEKDLSAILGLLSDQLKHRQFLHWLQQGRA